MALLAVAGVYSFFYDKFRKGLITVQ